MDILYLKNSIPWFGQHTGYETLVNHVRKDDAKKRVVIPSEAIFARAIGKAASLIRRHGQIAQGNAYARTRAEILLRTNKQLRLHILYGEDHLRYWQDCSSNILNRTIVTLHQPPSQWKTEDEQALSVYRNIIVLWQRDAQWFKDRISAQANLTFIRHGVDTEFFRPGVNGSKKLQKRLLFSGVHLRNDKMLLRIITALIDSHPDLRFDLLVPRHARTGESFEQLAHISAVTFHAGLDDESLKKLYQDSYLLLLPLDDSGANTAVVEALASGLPVVTTDVGGIRDYGGGDLFPVVANDDDDAMLSLINSYVEQPDWRDEIGRECRKFSERTMAWKTIVAEHCDTYARLN